jgi:hypothetical protein
VGPRLLEAELGIPQLKVFIIVADEREDADAIKWAPRRMQGGHQ